MDIVVWQREQECDLLAHCIDSFENGAFSIMTEQEAKALAERIRAQFPFHDVKATESADKRYWFVGVQRMDGGWILTFRAAYEWDEALHLLEVLKD